MNLLDHQRNTLWGLRLGLVMASVFSIWVIIIRLSLGPGVFQRFGISWGSIIAIYYGALCLGGSAYGALLPLQRYAAGAMLRGFVLFLPVYPAFITAIGLSRGSIPSWKVGVVVGIVLAAFGGSVLGLWMWIEEKNRVDSHATKTDDSNHEG